MHEEAPAPLGERLWRAEDPRLLRGEGRYTGDISLPEMLHAAFVRCPYGHARIERIDVDRARVMPGVEAVFTAADIPLLGKSLPVAFPQPGVEIRMPSPLARDIARYAGEIVAVVLAEEESQAADAAEMVEVEYEMLPAVIDPEEALQPDAPLVHDDVPGNLVGRQQQGYGEDFDAIAGRARVMIRRRFRADRAAGAAIEPRAVVATPSEEGGMTLWVSTQAPHGVRRSVARMLDLEPEQVRVIAPDVGGGFGPKGRFYAEEATVVILAHHLQRPVRWVATRYEDLISTYQGRALVAEAEMAATEDGRILGYRVRLLQDGGAYFATAMIVPGNTSQHLLGPYRLPAFSVEIIGIYTNLVPLTPLRGGGRELGVYITERMLDHLARHLDLDPREIRARNVIPPEEFPYDTRYPSRSGGTVVYDSGDYPAYLRLAHDRIGYDEFKRTQAEERRRGIFRGIAVTLFLEATGSQEESAQITLGEDGHLTIVVGSPSTGQGHATVMPQVAAAVLGVPVSDIAYHSGDTGAMEQGVGTFGSRMAIMAGNATAEAGRTLRAQLLHLAADELEAAPADLEIVEGIVLVRGVPSRGLSLSDLARRACERGQEDLLTAACRFAPEQPTAFAGGAHAAIVAVDVETGLIEIERYLVVHDCGTVLNPALVDGQVHGGVTHGIGNALDEAMIFDEQGGLLTASFATYAIPRTLEVPSFEVIHHSCPSPYNPEGIKGAGEGGTIGALATIARAVEDALAPFDLEMNELPIRGDRLALEIMRLATK